MKDFLSTCGEYVLTLVPEFTLARIGNRQSMLYCRVEIHNPWFPRQSFYRSRHGALLSVLLRIGALFNVLARYP